MPKWCFLVQEPRPLSSSPDTLGSSPFSALIPGQVEGVQLPCGPQQPAWRASRGSVRCGPKGKPYFTRLYLEDVCWVDAPLWASVLSSVKWNSNLSRIAVREPGTQRQAVPGTILPSGARDTARPSWCHLFAHLSLPHK